MFFIDKLIYKWILTKCAEIGGVFMLGHLEGAILYLGIFAFGLVEAIEAKKDTSK